MTSDDNNLPSMTSYTGTAKILVGDGKLLPIAHIENLRRQTDADPLTLGSVLHVPELKQNLLSVRQLF